jgi:hypothetical protein
MSNDDLDKLLDSYYYKKDPKIKEKLQLELKRNIEALEHQGCTCFISQASANRHWNEVKYNIETLKRILKTRIEGLKE